MEYITYLRSWTRHWRAIVLLAIIGAVVGYVATPGPSAAAAAPLGPGPTLWAATNVMALQPVNGITGAASAIPSMADLVILTTSTDIATKAAGDIHWSGTPAELAAMVTATLGSQSGSGGGEQTLLITATNLVATNATLISNAFARELSTYLASLQQTSQQQALAAQNAAVQTLNSEINTLSAQLPTDQKTPYTSQQLVIQAQRDADLSLYQAEYERLQELTVAPPPASPLVSIESAAPVPIDQDAALQPPKSATPTTTTTTAPASGTAAAASGPHRHSKKVYSGLGGLGGLVLGLGLAVGVDQVDPRLRTKEDIERVTGLPVLVEIPAQGGHKPAVSDPSSPTADAFRRLRTALLLGPLPSGAALEVAGPASRPVVERPRLGVVLITSPWMGEGKTNTVANLAVSLAEAHRTVLAVSGDFQHPMLHQYLDGSETPGFSDMLASDEPAANAAIGSGTGDGYIQATHTEGLALLASGTPGWRDVALLARATTVLPVLRQTNDVVLIDTPGLEVANDASEFLAETDSVLLVCRLGKSTKGRARSAVATLHRLGAPVIGIVLVDEDRGWISSRVHRRRSRAHRRPRPASAPPASARPASAPPAPLPPAPVRPARPPATVPLGSTDNLAQETDPETADAVTVPSDEGEGPPGPVRWERNGAAMVRVTPIGVMVLPPDTEEPTRLSGTGADLWAALEHPATLVELSARLAKGFDASPETIADDLTPILDDLVARNVLSLVPEEERRSLHH